MVAKVATLIDNGRSINTSLWTPFGPNYSDSGSALVVTSALASTYSGANSNANYDLTSSTYTMEIPAAGTQTITTWEVFPCKLQIDGNNWVSWRINGGNIMCRHVVTGTTTDSGSTAYSATTHKWLRLREASGTLFWEYSSNGTSWTSLFSMADPITLTSLQAQISAGTFGTEVSTTSAQFALINLPPGSAGPDGAITSAVSVNSSVAVTAAPPESDASATAYAATVTVAGSPTPPAASSSAAAYQPYAYKLPAGVMRSTFIQPSINASYPTINWSAAQFEADFAWMTSAGIHTVIVQWTVDQDANESYFASSGALPAEFTNMVGNILTAAAAAGVKVWLGLCNTFNWQAHAGDATWLSAQTVLNEAASDQLYSLFGGQFAGWYISNEVDDGLLATPADITPMTNFFTNNCNYLHTHNGNLRVMTSPRYSSLNLTPAAFASACLAVMGSVDILNVQDGGGSGYIAASDITNWFTALHSTFSSTTIEVWQNCDMFAPTSGPLASATLQANLQATNGLVNGHCGFSFITMMDPAILGSDSSYSAYRSYATTYFSAEDTTGSPTAAAATTTAYGMVNGLLVTPTEADAFAAAYAPVSAITALPAEADVAATAYLGTPGVAVGALPAEADVNSSAGSVSENSGTLAQAAVMTAGAFNAAVAIVVSAISSIASTVGLATYRSEPGRTFIVQQESRTLIIPKDDRTFVVEDD